MIAARTQAGPIGAVAPSDSNGPACHTSRQPAAMATGHIDQPRTRNSSATSSTMISVTRIATPCNGCKPPNDSSGPRNHSASAPSSKASSASV